MDGFVAVVDGVEDCFADEPMFGRSVGVGVQSSG